MSESEKRLPADSGAGTSLGLRERGKRERLERIVSAARELFLEKGYDRSTIRRIAKRAEVAVGTVFRYVASKEELLVLVFAEPIDRAVAEAVESLDKDSEPVEQLVHLFGRVLDQIGAHPALSRILLREVTFLEPDRAGARLRQAKIFTQRLGEGVRLWQDRGLIRADLDPELVARSFLALNFAQVVSFLSGEIETVLEAKAQLRASLQLLFEGLAP